MNGYDIDGVITIGVRPKKGDVVITGRTIDFYEETKDLEIDVPIYFNPYHHTIEDAGRWKAEMIQKLGIEKFYEDDLTQIKIIKLIYPKAKIIRIYQPPKRRINEKTRLLQM
jgi:hypothetical protein